MTSFFRQGAAIRALQERVAALSAEVAAAREQSAAAAAQHDRLGDSVAELAVLISTQAERLGQWREEGAGHDERLTRLRDEVTEQLARLRDEGEDRGGEMERLRREMDDRFDRWREESERRDEYMKRLRADLDRMERQAVIDLDEIRRTGGALAETLLAGRRGSRPAGS